MTWIQFSDIVASVKVTSDGDSGLRDCNGIQGWWNKWKRLLFILLGSPIIDNNLLDLTGQISKELCQYPVAQGNFGDIWKCTYRAHHPRLVAVKCLRVDIQDDNLKQTFTQRFERDLRQYAQLDHSNLLPFLGMTRGFSLLPAIVTPWMQNGSLTMFLENGSQHLANNRKLQILSDAASALHYLHSKQIIHGDLTSVRTTQLSLTASVIDSIQNNILINENGRAFVADHGILMLCSELSGTSYITNNVRWAAPENFRVSDDDKPAGPVKPACDIYSFGCIMLQVFTGRVPYSECRSDHQVVVQILRGKLPVRPVTPHIDDGIWDFIQTCWSDAEHRPLSITVLEFIQCQQKVSSDNL